MSANPRTPGPQVVPAFIPAGLPAHAPSGPDAGHRAAPGGGAALVGRAPAFVDAVEQSRRIAAFAVPVLLTGESGTGKELFARLIHDASPRAGGPFVTVNCATLSRTLAESDLFGHERGAFTGADGRRTGWFEEASGGTLVLDEIGELPLDLQPKLLRVLETGRLRRVGGKGEIAVDVRVVASTLRELPRLTIDGTFRSDLYHRLAGFEIRLPALRQRPGDASWIARQMLSDLAAEFGAHHLTADGAAALDAAPWPGNVRQLRNVVRRAAILGGPALDAAALRAAGLDDLGLLAAPTVATPPAAMGPAAAATPTAPRLADAPLVAPPTTPTADDVVAIADRSLVDIERDIFERVLRRVGGSRRQAARALGLCKSTFCDRARRLGVAA